MITEIEECFEKALLALERRQRSRSEHGDFRSADSRLPRMARGHRESS